MLCILISSTDEWFCNKLRHRAHLHTHTHKCTDTHRHMLSRKHKHTKSEGHTDEEARGLLLRFCWDCFHTLWSKGIKKKDRKGMMHRWMQPCYHRYYAPGFQGSLYRFEFPGYLESSLNWGCHVLFKSSWISVMVGLNITTSNIIILWNILCPLKKTHTPTRTHPHGCKVFRTTASLFNLWEC